MNDIAASARLYLGAFVSWLFMQAVCGCKDIKHSNMLYSTIIGYAFTVPALIRLLLCSSISAHLILIISHVMSSVLYRTSVFHDILLKLAELLRDM